MTLARARLGWSLVVDRDGRPVLAGPRSCDRAELYCLALQPRTCRLLVDQVTRWIATAERHYPIDDQVLLAARFAQQQLESYMRDFAVSAAVGSLWFAATKATRASSHA